MKIRATAADELSELTYDHDMEAAICSALSKQEDRLGAVRPLVTVEDFHSSLWRRTYGMILQLHDEGRPFDQVSLVAALREAGQLNGDAERLRVFRLDEVVHRDAPVEHYARTVAELAHKRRILGETPDDTPEPAEPLPGDLRSELTRAHAFVREHGRDLRHVVAWRKWLKWTGTHWQIDATGEVRRLAKASARAETMRALAESDSKIVKDALRAESAKTLDAVLTLASTEAGIALEPAVLDANPVLLNVGNGTIDLRTGNLLPHRRSDLLTKLIPHNYTPGAPRSKWTAFLDRVLPDPEVRSFVQRFLGYALTGKVGEHLLVFFYGTGRNGKSTLLGVVLKILGEYGVQAPPGLLLAVAEKEHPTAITTLHGKRLAVAMEAGEGRRFREELVKQLTGGDRVSARRMREDFWEFEPTHKIILSANHRPDIRGTDVAIWSRIALVPFTVTIPEPERDPDLPDKLLEEAPGILAWLVEGCGLWQATRLSPPAAVRAATADYRRAVDVVGDFIEERCVTYNAAKVTKGVLYGAYAKWAKDRGEEPLTQRAFGERMIERGFMEDREGKQRTRIWRGIGVLAEGETA